MSIIRVFHNRGNPFLYIPRSIRFLSILDKKNNPKRLTARHIQFLLYLQEEPEHYHSLNSLAKDLGCARSTIVKIKKELQQPTVETKTSLIQVNELRDHENQLHHQIEVFPDQESLFKYDEILFDKVSGLAHRKKWLDQWKNLK